MNDNHDHHHEFIYECMQFISLVVKFGILCSKDKRETFITLCETHYNP